MDLSQLPLTSQCEDECSLTHEEVEDVVPIEMDPQGCIQLSYFSGPWIIRITFILFVIWWGCIQLSYFSGPWIFLTLAFLLRAPLQEMELGILSRSWNGKTAGVSMQANGLHEKIFSFDMHMESLRRFLENI
jgi:hypothetical protein